MTRKYRVKIIPYKAYSSANPEVYYKIQKRGIFGIWLDTMEYSTKDKAWAEKTCLEMNQNYYKNKRGLTVVADPVNTLPPNTVK